MRSLTVALLLTAATLAPGALAASPVKITGNLVTGKRIFVAQQCGVCHMMAAAGARDGSGVGSDLDLSRKTYPQMIAQISKGGHGMTGYAGVLAPAQIQDLAALLYAASHHG